MHAVTHRFILSFFIFFILSTNAHADLGLSAGDFSGEKIDGVRVNGVQVDFQEDNAGNTGDQGDGSDDGSDSDIDDGSEGESGENSPVCQDEEGNAWSEGSECGQCEEDSTSGSCNNDTCVSTNSHVNIFTRQYQDDLVDMSVKVAGGYAKVFRLYAEGTWQFEHEYNRVRTTARDNMLKKGNIIYSKGSDGIYHFKTFTLQAMDGGYRWKNKKGGYVVYDQQGRMVETGDRRGVLTRYTYQGTHLLSINDRNNTPVYTFTYNDQGKINRAADQHGRTVSYLWNNDLLTRVTDVRGHTKRYSYSKKGQLTAKADEAGRMFFITYYPDGAVRSVLSRMEGGQYFAYKTNYAKVTTSMGKVTEYWFLDNGETSKVKLNGATIRTEEYYQAGRTTIDELGNRVIKTYDARDNLLTKEYADGSTISYTYDSHNKRLSRTNELGVQTRYTYNDMGLPTIIRKAYQTIDEQRTEHEYDVEGNLVQTTRFNGVGQVITSYDYDAKGNMVQEVNPVDGVTTITYDYMGNPLTTTDPVGLTTSLSYDLMGNVTQEIHANGRTIASEYDAANRLVKKIDSAGGTTSYEYDYQDNLIKIIDALGGIARFNFDKDNRLTKKVDQEGTYQVYFYEQGTDKISKVVDGNNNAIEITYQGFQDCGTCSKTYKDKPVQIKFPTFTRLFNYNLRGRLVKQTDKAEGIRQTTSFQYDKAGQRIAVTNAAGYTTQYEYDNLGRIVATIDSAGGLTNSEYDALGNLITVTDAKGQTTTFTYNQLGNKIYETRPMGNTFTYKYDQAGRLLQATDAKGQQKTYLYDTMGQLQGYSLQKSADSLPEKTVTLDFNEQGKLIAYDDGVTKGIYVYDLLGRQLKGQVDYGGFTTQHAYAYYKNGLKKSYTAPDGVTQYYQYNTLNLLTEISIPGVAQVSYNQFNWLLPEKVIFPGGKQSNTYDGLLRLTKRHSVAGGKTVLDLNYTYDTLNQVDTKQIADKTIQYGYDDLQRLIQVEKDGRQTEQYKYDSVHNRIGRLEHSDFAYNANNQLLRSDETQYQYDANGNTRSSSSPTETVEYIYNLENRLAQVTKNDLHAKYVYDPFGRRIAKNVNGEQTWFYYTDEGLVAEFSTSGKLQAGYSYTPHSMWTSNPVLLKRGSKTFFYHNDHLGTPHILTDATGSIVWKAAYNAFGKATVQTGQIENNVRFPGQYYDTESGKHYNWHRYYNAKTGRYISEDPIGLDGGMNLYAYVGGNPVNLIDPLGLAYFALRPLSGVPWLGPFSNNPLDDYFNTEIAHEQLIFEDGKSPSNIGFMGEGTLKEESDISSYRKTKTGFNDCVMRKAVKNVPLKPYSLLGKPGPVDKFNCQDWVEEVRKEYNKLLNDPKVKKDCCIP